MCIRDSSNVSPSEYTVLRKLRSKLLMRPRVKLSTEQTVCQNMEMLKMPRHLTVPVVPMLEVLT